MMDKTEFEGGCTCRAVRYRMHRAPLFVNCCHCRWCQRESGAAFALNGVLEATELTVLKGGAPAVPEYYDWRDFWPDVFRHAWQLVASGRD